MTLNDLRLARRFSSGSTLHRFECLREALQDISVRQDELEGLSVHEILGRKKALDGARQDALAVQEGIHEALEPLAKRVLETVETRIAILQNEILSRAEEAE